MLAITVIFVVAFLARFLPTMRGSGLFGINYYDDGVHYAAAVGLVHGQLPYRDFLLLHPPGILVALAPFAAVGSWTGDARGFALARLGFMALGGVNALLVSRFLRPVGVFAAWTGGLAYALFWPAIYSEHTVLLEGLANTCLLVALLLVIPSSRTPSDRTPSARTPSASITSDRTAQPTTTKLLVAGAALGFAATIKIWGVVPILLLVGWLIFRSGPRRAGIFLGGAVIGTTTICLPFFLAAPTTMWKMVVVDQVERNVIRLPVVERLNEIFGLSLYDVPNRWTAALVLALVLMLLASIVSCLDPRTVPAVLLLIGMGALLLITPSWFVHYTALTAAVVAIVVGAGAQWLVDVPGVGRLRVVLGAVLVGGMVLGSLPVATASVGSRFPGRTLAAATTNRPGCVTSDHPSTLILMNVIGRNLERGCPLVVDLGGASYHLDSPQRGVTTRRRNDVFQVYALDYLSSGDTTIIARFRRNYGLNADSWKTVQSWPAAERAGGYTVRQPPR